MLSQSALRRSRDGIMWTALKSHSLLTGYTIVFAVTATWFVLGTVFVRQIRGVR